MVRRLPFVLMFGLAVASGARAQSLEDRLRAQLVAVTTQLRDAQSAQAALTARADAAEKTRDALKAQLAAAQAKLRTVDRVARPAAPPPELEQYRARAEQLQQADAQDKSQLSAAQGETARLNEQLARLGADRDRAATGLAADETALTSCRTKNAQAIQVAKDVLRAYDRVSMADVLARKEPFTGLRRVQIEQLEQDYGDRLYDSRLDVRPRKTATPTSNPVSATGGATPK